ncbi:MAG: type II toxin-antitoxin system RelE/ParE family toxin [Eubacteriales bacterium]|nr:type II toxin-antitoxin system RelE/ParE family toxin [Eubacteriales bacterium]
MDKYEVMLYPKAFRDIDDIYAYIALEKLSPEIAKSQTDRIWKALRSLEIFPESHQDRLVGRYAGKGYKQLIIDNYLAVFKIDGNNKKVYVLTVQYQGRNF